MTIFSAEQIDALRELRHDLGATAVAAHEIAHGSVWVSMWRETCDADTPVWRGTISAAGTVREFDLADVERGVLA